MSAHSSDLIRVLGHFSDTGKKAQRRKAEEEVEEVESGEEGFKGEEWEGEEGSEGQGGGASSSEDDSDSEDEEEEIKMFGQVEDEEDDEEEESEEEPPAKGKGQGKGKQTEAASKKRKRKGKKSEDGLMNITFEVSDPHERFFFGIRSLLSYLTHEVRTWADGEMGGCVLYGVLRVGALYVCSVCWCACSTLIEPASPLSLCCLVVQQDIPVSSLSEWVVSEPGLGSVVHCAQEDDVFALATAIPLQLHKVRSHKAIGTDGHHTAVAAQDSTLEGSGISPSISNPALPPSPLLSVRAPVERGCGCASHLARVPLPCLPFAVPPRLFEGRGHVPVAAPPLRQLALAPRARAAQEHSRGPDMGRQEHGTGPGIYTYK